MAVLLVLDGFFVAGTPYANAAISDGMNALDVLGQGGSFTSSTGNAYSATGLRAPTAVAVDTVHHRLFVGNNFAPDILVYNLNASNVLVDRTADNVLGAPDIPGGPDWATNTFFDNIDAMAYDPTGDRLFVADSAPSTDRILVFNTSTIVDGEDAVNVLGQPNLGTFTFPSSPTPSNMRPRGLAFDDANDRLFVVDENFSSGGGMRVMVFDVSSITNGEAAVNVLGQPDFTTNTANTQNAGNGCTTTPNACGLSAPKGVAYDSGNQRLFVADSGNDRILVFDVSSITDGEAATKVLGKSTFTDGSSSSASQSQFSTADGLAYDGAHQRLFLTSGADNRTLMFDVTAITNGENAANVIGQANFTAVGAATTQSGQSGPNGVAYGTNDVLYVVDSSNNRALLYDAATGGDVTPPVISGTASGSITSSGATITWSTDESSDSKVNYGLTGGYGSTTTNGSMVTSHSVTLSGLSPSTLYHYQACSKDASLNESCTGDFTFTTSAAPTNDPTLSNKIVLSRLKAGVTATANVHFTLQNTLSGTLTVTLPAGFTVTGAATGGSACLSSFGFTSSTLTATKTNCSGAITMTGATVTNPSTPGAYHISWVNDDPGGGDVFIVDDDQVTVSGAVDPQLTFNVGSQIAACDGTFSGSGGALGLGALTTSAVASSDVSSVPHVCSRLTTNGSGGAVVSARSAFGALRSASTPADQITSATSTLVAATAGYGLCAGSSGGDSGRDTTTPAGATPVAAAPFNGACSTSGHAVGALTTSPQTVWSITGASQNAFFRLFLKASVSPTTAAHADYVDTLTFIATGTY